MLFPSLGTVHPEPVEGCAATPFMFRQAQHERLILQRPYNYEPINKGGHDGHHTGLRPHKRNAEQEMRFASRPASLRGLRIGLVENTKYNSSALLLRIAAILEKEHGAQSHILRSKRTPGHPWMRKRSRSSKPPSMW